MVQPGIRLRSVNPSYAADAPDDAIWADVGPDKGAGGLGQIQPVRAAAGPLTVTFTSGDPEAAVLVTSGETGGTVSALIAPSLSNTPTLVGTGGVAIDPLAGGLSTAIGVSAEGFVPSCAVQTVVP